MTETAATSPSVIADIPEKGPEHLTPNQRAWLRFKANQPAMLSAVFLALFLGLIFVWPFVSKTGPNALSNAQFQPPNSQHWCGTDIHGRDVFARIIYGARISLMVGAVGALVSLVIGVSWGAIAGYIGGRIDDWMMRFVDILYSLPSIIFVIVLITTLEEVVKKTVGQNPFGISLRLLFLFVGLGAVSWLTMARIVRGQVLSLRNRQFVMATRSLG